MPVPILKQGTILIASVQAALTDSDAERLRLDLMERVSRYRAHGIIVDVTAIDVMDSFAARSLRTIAHMTRLRGADTVIVGPAARGGLRDGPAGAGVRRHVHGAGLGRRLRAAESADWNRVGRRSGATVPTDFVVDVNNSDDIVIARQAGHELARQLGFSLTDVTMIATAISEIARNITSYAGRGEVRVGVQYRDGRKALVVRAEDEGPGIVDVERALEDGYSTGRGLGLGLPGARRLMDRLIVESAPGKGTVVEMWKWIPPRCDRERLDRTDRVGRGASPPTRRGGVRRLSDRSRRRRHCRVVRRGGRAGSRRMRPRPRRMRAAEVVNRCRTEPLDVLLQLCHRGLADTRGAAITLARIDFETDTLSWIGIGNVTADLVAKTTRRCPDPGVCAAVRRHRGLPHTPRTGHATGFDQPRRPARHRDRRHLSKTT